jgi:SAM-dependent methyltransferase
MSVPGTEHEDTLKGIRESYDTVAEEYARRIYGELAHKPFDRAALDRFADRVRNQGEVCDLGCGPGQVGRYLFDRGVQASGLDLSPAMVETARRLNPDMNFRTGDILQLPFDDNSLAGFTAFHAIVNLPKNSLPTAVREMHRVLKPGGLLLLAFHVGDEVLQEEELWGLKISMTFYMFNTLEISALLGKAGFTLDEVTERDPYPPDVEYQSRRAYILARKAL